MTRQHTTSGSPFEATIGFSRGVRVGTSIKIAGTGPIAPDGTTASPGDAYGQAKRCLEIIHHAIRDLGGEIEDVVRTRVYLVDVNDWEAAGRAHGEVFSDIKPAATMIVVQRLIVDDWLVEIEAECVTEQ